MAARDLFGAQKKTRAGVLRATAEKNQEPKRSGSHSGNAINKVRTFQVRVTNKLPGVGHVADADVAAAVAHPTVSLHNGCCGTAPKDDALNEFQMHLLIPTHTFPVGFDKYADRTHLDSRSTAAATFYANSRHPSLRSRVDHLATHSTTICRLPEPTSIAAVHTNYTTPFPVDVDSATKALKTRSHTEDSQHCAI